MAYQIPKPRFLKRALDYSFTSVLLAWKRESSEKKSLRENFGRWRDSKPLQVCFGSKEAVRGNECGGWEKEGLNWSSWGREEGWLGHGGTAGGTGNRKKCGWRNEPETLTLHSNDDAVWRRVDWQWPTRNKRSRSVSDLYRCTDVLRSTLVVMLSRKHTSL